MNVVHERTRVTVEHINRLSTADIARWDTWVSRQVHLRRAFLSHTYCRIAATVNPTARVIAVRDAGGELQAILPIQRAPTWAGRLGVHEPIGGSLSDYFGLIAAPGTALTPRELLRQAAVGLVAYTHLDETNALATHSGSASSARIGLRTRILGRGDAHWQDLRARDKKLVADTERRERKLASEHGPVQFQLHSAQPEQDMDLLFDLKRDQYRRTGKLDAALFNSGNESILRSLLRARDPLCTGMLSVLRAGDRIVALHFGLRCAEMLHVWFPAYATEFSSYSPGRILLKHLIREGSLEGLEVLDRGEGDTPAKRDLANEEHMFEDGVWWSPNMQGMLARLALAIKWRLS